ncbi:hypothetical protein [Hymenobacter wooponensis]|uniref:Uncharacterized protein n=1 Tax=Hymenobacter wooponensis TaxID=1525360 RepID=A0A4Z0MBN0_9BACT|nr:hypothetical protein [Hymenobacter wooponensis]TGD76911.1 hypothetical protein EU557_24940 [Hymenobacter wooponensis]
MTTSRKIKVIIEVEVIESEHLPSSQSITWNLPVSDEEAKIEEFHNQVLLNALRADTDKHTEFIKTIILGSIEPLELNQKITGMLQIGSPYSDSIAILQNLFPQLPKSSQQYFQQAIQEGWLSEGIELVFNTIQARPTNLTIQYP